MASIDDLELEVKRLRERLTAAENAPAARRRAEADEIVSGGNAHRRGKFSVVCDAARAQTAAEELAKARQAIIDNPKIIDGGSEAEGAFYSRYPMANMDELRTLVRKAKAVLHPPPTFDDVPEVGPGEFVRFKR